MMPLSEEELKDIDTENSSAWLSVHSARRNCDQLISEIRALRKIYEAGKVVLKMPPYIGDFYALEKEIADYERGEGKK